MGYQEAFRPIEHFAEAAGIKKAIEEYDNCGELSGYCNYFCASRRKSDDKLFVCVGGDRCVVIGIAGYFLDCCIPYDANYSDFYEDLDEELVEKSAQENPHLVEIAYLEIKVAFERMIEENREQSRALRREANEVWPDVVKFLQAHGPSPWGAFSASPIFKGHDMMNVLSDLSKQGLIDSEGRFFSDDLRLSAKALDELGIKNPTSPKTLEERLDLAFWELGPASSTALARCLGLSSNKTAKLLKEQIESGHVVREGRGRSCQYRLRNETNVEQTVAK